MIKYFPPFRFVFCSLIFLFTIFSIDLNAQKRKIDSMEKLIAVAPNDSARIALMFDGAKFYTDTAQRVRKMKEAYSYAEKCGSVWGQASTQAKIGFYYMFIYVDYPLATYWTTRSLKVSLNHNYNAGVGQAYQQLGIISHVFDDEISAIDYFKKAAAINEKLNLPKSLRTNYSMLGLSYMELHLLDTSLFYYLKAKQVSITNKINPSVLYVNMTNIYIDLNMLDSAERYVKLTDEAYKAAQNEYGEHWVNLLSGEIELKRGNIQRALAFFQEPIDYARKSQNEELLTAVLPPLIKAYKLAGKYKDGFFALEELNNLNDSISGTKSAGKVLAIRKQFEEEQLAEIEKLKQEKNNAAHKAEIKDRNNIIWGGGVLLLLISLFGIIVLRSYRQKKKANHEIMVQKSIIEEKQKEIVDSIHYAKRIQSSILPTEKYMEKKLIELKKTDPK